MSSNAPCTAEQAPAGRLAAVLAGRQAVMLPVRPWIRIPNSCCVYSYTSPSTCALRAPLSIATTIAMHERPPHTLPLLLLLLLLLHPHPQDAASLVIGLPGCNHASFFGVFDGHGGCEAGG